MNATSMIPKSSHIHIHPFPQTILWLAVSAILTMHTNAATNIVNSLADAGSGSLRQVIADSATGDTIVFGVTGTITLTNGELVIDKDLNIVGPGAESLGISGNHIARVFLVQTNAAVTMANLKIADGMAREGGGILNLGGNVGLTGVQFHANTASHEIAPEAPGSAAGGGMFNQGGTVAATNCVFLGNRAQQLTPAGTAPSRTRGGALCNESGEVRLKGCLFESNSVVGAPGPFNIRGTAHEARGGAIVNSGTVEAIACRFVRNQAMGGEGGGIGGEGGLGNGGAFCNLGTARLTDCIFASNSTSGGVGGVGRDGLMYPEPGDAGGQGGSANGGGLFNAGRALVAGCIFTNNLIWGGAGGVGGVGSVNAGPPDKGGGLQAPGGQGGEGGFARGAAICDANALCVITNCVVASNSAVRGAGGPGGGFDGPAGLDGSALGAVFSVGAIVMQSVFSSNAPGGNCAGTFTDGGRNFSLDCSCSFTNNSPPKAGPPGLPQFRIIHNFTGQEERYADGHPFAALSSGSNGVFYGVTLGSAWPGAGSVFKVNSDGTDSSFAVLRGFGNNPSYGPAGAVVRSGDVIYGATVADGQFRQGTVFRINTDGSGYAILHSFGDAGDGRKPSAGLTLSGSTLYGTTQFGGSVNRGTIFRIETNGSGYSIIKHFLGGPDGSGPNATLLLSESTLYGTTWASGRSGESILFKINADGGAFAVLKHFEVAESPSYPHGAGLALSGATLYGTTPAQGFYGNPEGGSVFKINTDGSGFTFLKRFPTSDAPGRDAGLICLGEHLYGTTTGDGGLTSYGTVFTMEIDGSGYMVLKRFNGFDGDGSNGNLLMLDDTLYGTTENGGFYGAGVAFALSLSPPDIGSTSKSQTVEFGSDVNLLVEAAGFPAPTCQWYFNTNTPVAGATNLSLRLDAIQFSQAGVYTLVLISPLGATTSAPIALSVIAPVERRLVPGITLTAETGTTATLECIEALGAAEIWQPLGTTPSDNPSPFWFDLTEPLPPQRFYRTSQSGLPAVAPLLEIHMIPALTLNGEIGTGIRVDGINRFGPVDDWFTLDTVTLTNTSQFYFDISVIGQPPRLYRLVPDL